MITVFEKKLFTISLFEHNRGSPDRFQAVPPRRTDLSSKKLDASPSDSMVLCRPRKQQLLEAPIEIPTGVVRRLDPEKRPTKQTLCTSESRDSSFSHCPLSVWSDYRPKAQMRRPFSLPMAAALWTLSCFRQSGLTPLRSISPSICQKEVRLRGGST
jgi:hypothetical protein